MKEKKQSQKEDRLIFIILALILLVAIGVILTWYFTKDNKLDEDDKKNPNPVVEPEKEDEEDNTNNEGTFVPTPKPVKPTPVSNDEEEKEEEPTPTEPKDTNWVLPELPDTILINEEFNLPTKIVVGDETVSVTAVVQKFNTLLNDWETVAKDVTSYTPTEAGLYRLVYTIGKVSRTWEFSVSNGVSNLSDFDIVALEQYYLGHPDMEAANRFPTIKDNLSKVSSTFVNGVFNLSVNEGLASFPAEATQGRTDPYLTPVGLLVQTSILEYDGILTSISASIVGDTNDSVSADLLGTEPWGADPTNGLFLVWFDFSRLAFDTQYQVELEVNGEIVNFSIIFIKNYVEITGVTPVAPGTSGTSDPSVKQAIDNNMDPAVTDVSTPDPVDPNTVDVTTDTSELKEDDVLSGIIPIGLVIKFDEEIVGTATVSGTGVLENYEGSDYFSTSDLDELIVWLNAAELTDGVNTFTITVNGKTVDLIINYTEN